MLLACLASISPLIAASQTVSVSPTSLSFGNQVQGTAISAKTLSLKNGQTTAITINSITSSLSDYTQTNTCPVSPSTLNSGKSCTITVTFKPSALGSRTATLSVRDTGSNSPQTVSLSGTGIASVTVSPSSLQFGNQSIGLKSTASKVTITNNQSASISITSISTNLSDYTTSTTCPLSPRTLAARSSCTVAVFFTPALAGLRNATLSISDNASVSPSVSLTGTGVVAAVASPATLNFSSQAVGTSGSPQAVTLTNNQSTTLSITRIISNLSDFVASSNCPISPSTLAAGASCAASVTFSPKAQGTRTGTLSFNDNANNTPQIVSLTGTGGPPNLVSIAVTPANSSIVAGTSLPFTATGTYTDSSTQNLTSTVAWSSTAGGIASISGTGLVTGVASGSTSIIATSGSISGSTTLTVSPPTLVSLAITPANFSFAAGTTQALKATATYTDGSTQDVTKSAVWGTANPAVATVNAQGVASSVSLGTTSVTAQSGSIIGSTNLTVTPATLVSLAVTPAIPSIPLGTAQQFSATGTFTDGTTQNLTSTVQWSSDAASVATISNSSNKQGLATSAAPGTTNITAASGSVTGTTTLTVTSAGLVTIAVTPQSPSVAVGTTQQFAATGTFTDGSTQDLTNSATWVSDNTSIATVNNGSATGIALGSANISASSGSTTGSASLTVTPAQLVSIAITPQAASVPRGVPQQFIAAGTYTDGTLQDLTQSGHWSSTDSIVATISNAVGTQGVATTLSAGTTTIGISSGSITGSATLAVNHAALVSIAINPINPTIPLGSSQQFFATGTYTDGSTQDLSSTVTWSCSSNTVAVISNTLGAIGLATSSGLGSCSITASQGSISSATNLTVAGAALVTISLSPDSASIPLGTTQQFIATGTYTDGSTLNLTGSAVWSSDTPAVASIGAGGVTVGVGLGAANITATSGAIQASAALAVGPPVLVSIALSPATASVAAGRSQQFTATGTYSDGSMQNLTSAVIWSSSLPTIAAVDGAGSATSLIQGTTTITGASGPVTASATLTVTAPELTSIAVFPPTASIPDGTKQQFTATGTYSDGNTQNLTGSVSWSSSAPGVAVILSTGLATGTGIGSAIITATSGSISGTSSLGVSQPALTSIAVTPANASFALGTGQPLKATGTYTDGSTLDLTATVAWSTAEQTIATVNNLGSATSIAVGSTTVSAANGFISGSTTLTVTPAALVSIAITPAIPSIPSGTTVQFAATGTFTDGSTQDVTKTVQWTSDSPAMATFDDGANQIGLATGISTGTATIAASSGLISGSTTLNITAAVLVSIGVTPPSPSIALGTTQQFAAVARFSDGSTQDLTSTVAWTSDANSTAGVSTTGLASSLSQGSANISATFGNIVGSAVLTVTAADLLSLSIDPSTVTLPLGVTQQFTATGTYSDGTTQDVTQSAHWSSTNSAVSTISNSSGMRGVATTLAVGTTTIEITAGGVTAAAPVTVTSAALVSISISPQAPVIPLGTSQQFAAIGTYTDGTTQDVTTTVTWSSSSAAVLVISNTTGASGRATSSGPGTATVTALSGAVSSSVIATVTQAAVTGISIAPAGTSVAQGYTLQFAATGTYSDGSTQDLTQSVVWSSSFPNVATINSAGLATALLPGATIISGTSGSISSSTPLTVSAPEPVLLLITPTSPSIYISGQKQFTATLQYSDGMMFDVTSSAGWTSSPAVATISSSGLATGISAGSSVIQATWGNLFTATASLNVLLPSVTVTPARVSVVISGTQQFSATVTGNSNQTVTWAVDGITGGSATLGTISSGGLYLAPPMIGTHAVTATAQANSGSIGAGSLTIGTPVPLANTFFGMHLHLVGSPVPGAMEGAARIWDSAAAQWPNLNTANGIFVWTNLDNVLASYKLAGINDVLYTLWRVPKWASSNPSDTTCDYASSGTNHTGECDLPTDLNPDGTGTDLIWRTWVQNIAQHVNGDSYLQNHAKISYWEPCNECFRSPTLDPGYGAGGATVAYRGTYNQLVRMMQDARCIILGTQSDPITALGTTCGQAGYPLIGIDPSAKMVMPSTSPIKIARNTPSYPQVMQNLLYCTCANNSCSASTTGCTTGSAGSAAVDILSVHVYPNLATYTPETIPSQISNVRSLLQQAELAKPLWSDEGGWGKNTTATQVSTGDPDMEAAWLARFHLMMWASGLGRAYWYEWDNALYGTLWSSASSTGCTKQFTSGYLCSGAIAYQQVYNWLVGSTLINCSAVGTTWTCNLIQSSGSSAEILWDTSQSCSNGTCGTVNYAVPNIFHTYSDLTGASYTISGSVPVGIKPILVTQSQ